MKEPTQEQIKEFWEWCGVKEITYKRCSCHPQNIGKYWHDLDGNYLPEMPEPDLNNLFKYAVPKLTHEYIEIEIHLDYLIKSNTWNVSLLDGFYDKDEPRYLISVKNNKELALALFWAIWEVINERK